MYFDLLARRKMIRLESSSPNKIYIGASSHNEIVNSFGSLFRGLHKNYWYALRICVLVVVNFFECEKCGNCCRYSPPTFKQEEAERIANFLNKQVNDLPLKPIFQYFKIFYKAPKPCPFLNSDNTCSIYPVRGAACRSFPHEWLMYSMVPSYCPAIFKAIEKAIVFIKEHWDELINAIDYMEQELRDLARSSQFKEEMRYQAYKPLVEKLFEFIKMNSQK